MKNENLKEKYDQVFSAGSEKFFSVNYFNEAHTIVGMGEWQNKAVLDVGCGEGVLCSMAAHAGASRVVGIDYSSEAIANANKKFNMDNSKVDDLLEWLSQAKDFFKPDNDSGAVVVYKITK